MSPKKPDYSLYLVTDSTMIPQNSMFLGQVQQAVTNGATIVQLREKKLLTLDFVERARKVLEITRPKGVPLIINDRIDVALAVDADGVHVGQDDMPAREARRLLGPDKILGVSCTSEEEALQVCKEGVADYVGLGTLYPTNTKDVKNVCGPIGVRRMLQVLNAHKQTTPLSCVAIGGINHSNAAKVLYQCRIEDYKLDGVAVVSCIMASEDAGEATRALKQSLAAPVPWNWNGQAGNISTWQQKPLVHHITNNVVKNFSANVTLAIGASPIMSELTAEFDEFAQLPLPVGLVVNLGTPNEQLLGVMLEGLKAYNKHGKPVLFDPVAAGASEARLTACKRLLNAGQFSVIKGNLGEIAALGKLASSYKSDATHEASMQGVDSLAVMDTDSKLALAMRVAKEFQAVVVITGKDDIVADGSHSHPRSTYFTASGHELMGSVTGTGCSLGSVICSFVAVAQQQRISIFDAVVAGLVLYNLAGKRAAQKSAGPGSFAANFLDELAALKSKGTWMEFAR